MIDVSPLVGDIPTVTVTLRVFDASTQDTYGRTLETFTDETIEVVAHPAPARMVEKILGSGKHTRGKVAFYATQAIEVAGRRPDQIQYQGVWYAVDEVEDYITLGGLAIALGSRIEGA